MKDSPSAIPILTHQHYVTFQNPKFLTPALISTRHSTSIIAENHIKAIIPVLSGALKLVLTENKLKQNLM